MRSQDRRPGQRWRARSSEMEANWKHAGDHWTRSRSAVGREGRVSVDPLVSRLRPGNLCWVLVCLLCRPEPLSRRVTLERGLPKRQDVASPFGRNGIRPTACSRLRIKHLRRRGGPADYRGRRPGASRRPSVPRIRAFPESLRRISRLRLCDTRRRSGPQRLSRASCSTSGTRLKWASRPPSPVSESSRSAACASAWPASMCAFQPASVAAFSSEVCESERR
jgi:hypothetical protein